MIEAAALAVLTLSGADPRRVAILALAFYLPVVVAGLVALAAWGRRAEKAGRSALFCEGVAAELRSGSSMRQALLASAESVGVSLPPGVESATSSELAEGLADDLPDIADEVALVVRSSGRTGGRAADLFDEIGSLAIAQDEIAREVRVSAAPTRATAAVFLVAPLLYLMWRLGQGELSGLLGTSQQRVAATVGLGLFLAGLTVAARIMWRAG